MQNAEYLKNNYCDLRMEIFIDVQSLWNVFV